MRFKESIVSVNGIKGIKVTKEGPSEPYVEETKVKAMPCLTVVQASCEGAHAQDVIEFKRKLMSKDNRLIKAREKELIQINNARRSCKNKNKKFV